MNELFNFGLAPTNLKPEVLKELLILACCGVEFSFKYHMYKQIDRISMGSPLGPILSNTFVGFHEKQLIKDISPIYYKRYIDDTFVIFAEDKDRDAFLLKLNGMHANLEFIIKKATENKLAFLDVIVHWENQNFYTNIYRKRIFSNDYVRYNSYSPMR